MRNQGLWIAGGCLLGAQVLVSALTVVHVRKVVRAGAPAPAAVPAPAPAPAPPEPLPVAPPPPPVLSETRIPPSQETRVRAAVRRAAPALLHILNKREGSVGSGFVIDAQGHALSNAHVVGEAKDVRCMLYDGQEISVKVLARDYVLDLALLKLDLRNEQVAAYVKPLEFGDSDALCVGDPVLALGSPHGLNRSVSFGIVSNLRRFGGELAMPRGGVSGLMNLFLQTDAAINPGNSGGPLVDLDGKVVGVNSRGYPLADGLGMSIPSRVVREAFEVLKALPQDREGRVEHTLIGVELAPFNPADDECEWAYKLEKGVKVACVFPDSPAEAAGLKKGDILVRIDGKEVDARSEEDLPAVYGEIDRHPPEASFPVEVQREQAATLTVAGLSSHAFYQSIRMPSIGLYARAPYDTEVRGQQGAVVTARIEEFPGYDRDSQTQLQVGDVIRRVDGIPVRSFSAFYDQIRSSHGPVPARLFEVVRGKRTVLVKFPYEGSKSKEPEAGTD